MPPAGPRRRWRLPAPVWFRRPTGWWLVAVAVVLALLAGEGFARVVGPDLPRAAGTDEESVLKGHDIDQRARERTDVVALGASETAAGVTPRTLDAASSRFTGAYNASLRGASLSTTRRWAERVVLPRLQPRVAIIGLLPIELARYTGDVKAFNDRSDRAYRQAFGRVDPDTVGRIEQRVSSWSALVRHRDELRRPTVLVQGIRAAITGHRKALPPQVDPEKIRSVMAPSGESLEYLDPPEVVLADRQLAADINPVARGGFDLTSLRDLVAAVRARGVQPVIALSPLDRRTMGAAGVDLARLDQVAQQVVQLGDRLGVPVVDGFRATDWAPELFHDKQHLDAAGAARWSAQLGHALDRFCTERRLGGACSAG